MGVRFSVVVPDVAELAQGDPVEVVVENARRKAAAVAPSAGQALVLGVDTLVWADQTIYGKPNGREEARATLTALSSTTHSVISGICLIRCGEVRVAHARTTVRLRELDRGLLDWYLDSGEWRERAGSYAVQSWGAALVSEIHGDYLNVVGLPLATLLGLEPGLISA